LPSVRGVGLESARVGVFGTLVGIAVGGTGRAVAVDVSSGFRVGVGRSIGVSLSATRGVAVGCIGAAVGGGSVGAMVSVGETGEGVDVSTGVVEGCDEGLAAAEARAMGVWPPSAVGVIDGGPGDEPRSQAPSRSAQTGTKRTQFRRR
jgi:hypothetical protein